MKEKKKKPNKKPNKKPDNILSVKVKEEIKTKESLK